MTEKTGTRRWRHLISQLVRARSGSAPSAPGEFLPTRCFGPLGDSEQLALEGFIAGRGPWGETASRESAEEDGSG